MKQITSLLLLVLLFVGCAEKLPTTEVPVQTITLKDHLNGLSESGYLGSGAENVRQAYAELEKSDPAKAKIAKEPLEEIFRSDGNPEKVKKLAKELAEKL